MEPTKGSGLDAPSAQERLLALTGCPCRPHLRSSATVRVPQQMLRCRCGCDQSPILDRLRQYWYRACKKPILSLVTR
jgi:hypothetical protein